MNENWLQSRENYGVCGAYKDVDYAPDVVANRNHYRWTCACQRAFLEELACTGSVMSAAKIVRISTRSADNLKYRRDEAAFRLG